MLSQIAEWCEGRLVGDDVTIACVSTDSREDLTGALFVALRGERFDAHDFAAQAADNGAAGLLLHKPVPRSAPRSAYRTLPRARLPGVVQMCSAMTC